MMGCKGTQNFALLWAAKQPARKLSCKAEIFFAPLGTLLGPRGIPSPACEAPSFLPHAGLSELFFPTWPLLPKWLTFLDTQKTVSKDAWSRLRHYVATVKLDLSNQDDDRELELIAVYGRSAHARRAALRSMTCASAAFLSFFVAASWPVVFDDFKAWMARNGAAGGAGSSA